MQKEIKNTIHAKDTEISVLSSANKDDYISLTDLAKYRDIDNPRFIIQNWMRSRNVIEFLGLWEQLNNNDFNRVEFEAFKNEAGSNGFVLTPQKWIKSTNAIGLISKSGRYGGGTFAHKDIAFEFASWISPEFKLYVIQDYQRLKTNESYQYSLDWTVKRLLTKANYKIHTNAIKQNLIPPSVTKQQQGLIYASEADLLNVALFGKTAAQWRQDNPDAKGNMRDYATIEQLLVLSNLENINAIYIGQGLPQSERLKKLNQLAITQLHTVLDTKSVKRLNSLNESPKLE